jgi:hypothetical protein
MNGKLGPPLRHFNRQNASVHLNNMGNQKSHKQNIQRKE